MEEVKALCLRIDMLIKQVEDTLGLHLNTCLYFCQLREAHIDTIKRYDYSNILDKLQVFADFEKLKNLKSILLKVIRKAKTIIPYQEFDPALIEAQRGNLLLPFDKSFDEKTTFESLVNHNSKTLNLSDLDIWLAGLDYLINKCQSLAKVDEDQLV